jgi:hypothetical protein
MRTFSCLDLTRRKVVYHPMYAAVLLGACYYSFFEMNIKQTLRKSGDSDVSDAEWTFELPDLTLCVKMRHGVSSHCVSRSTPCVMQSRLPVPGGLCRTTSRLVCQPSGLDGRPSAGAELAASGRFAQIAHDLSAPGGSADDRLGLGRTLPYPSAAIIDACAGQSTSPSGPGRNCRVSGKTNLSSGG